jgi:3-oxoacyl-[acyl-carrier protein] reductase
MNEAVEVTLVMAGSRGIGRAVVERQAAEGQCVINLDPDPAPPALPAISHRVDFTDLEQTRGALAQVMAEHAPTRLVNAAGLLVLDPVETLSLDSFDRAIEVSVRTAMLAAQAVLPAMKAAGFGRIVNLTGQAALGMERRTGDSAAKGALNTITRTWAIELARHGITVNAVAAGAVRDEASDDPQSDPMRASIERSIALGRLGEPEEIAQGIAFFLDRRTSYATGQLLYLCGGLTIGGITGD